MFGEDAKTAAVLDLTLTTRPVGDVGRVEMCGVPIHALEQSVETLRDQYDVAVSAVDTKSVPASTHNLFILRCYPSVRLSRYLNLHNRTLQ